MLRVGLTGGTAVGKSTVMRLLAARPHVYVVDADEIVHALYRQGNEVTRRIGEAFGAAVLSSNGSVDRARLGRLVFDDPAKLTQLEEIVHPAVIAEQKRALQGIAARDPQAIAVVEATKMLEAGTYKDYDAVLLVVARPEVQLQRYCARGPRPAEEASAELARRGAAQFTDEQRRALVKPEFVIENSGPLQQTSAQVDRIFEVLRKAAEKTS